jgi:hypothetical protein
MGKIDIHATDGSNHSELVGETFSPRDALSAISSAEGVALNVFDIALLLRSGRFPGCDQSRKPCA